jgi:hypothetical protein
MTCGECLFRRRRKKGLPGAGESIKFAQHLHSIRHDIEFAHFLHKPEFCTKFAQDLLPKDTIDCQK